MWSHISRGDGARGRVRESGHATCGVGIGVKASDLGTGRQLSGRREKEAEE